MVKRIFIILLVLCAVLSLPTMFNIFTMPIIGMLRSAAIFEQKASHLIQMASTFDQNKVLQKLKTNSINKNYYLFDEHLEMAKVDQNSFPAFKTASTASFSSGFNFDDTDEIGLTFHKAEHKIKDGVCFIKSSPDSFITNAQELSLSRAGLSEIEIRLKAKQGKELLLGLSSNPDAQWSNRDKTVKEVVVETFKLPFKDICTLTLVPEGTIVRTIVRLDETCREVRNAARIIGDPSLHKKMEAASMMIKRDIVFASSLYVS